jgi:hypothetical protein
MMKRQSREKSTLLIVVRDPRGVVIASQTVTAP